MLVATRDPHPGAQHAPPPRDGGSGPGAPRIGRFVTALQIAGSLLAIPVGLASAYSLYRANFSVETTCQNLRGNIISMIDKQVDAGTKRMLVRRDVETFERTCGGVDPDAEAAFKTLLAADKKPVVAAVPAKEPIRKAETRPSVAAKPAEAPAKQPAAAAAVEPVQREAVVSDTKWLEAVRGALVAREAATTANAVPPASAEPPSLKPALPPTEAVAPAVPAAPESAPALPPPTAVAAPVTPQPQADPDHPVPPSAIPDTGANGVSRSTWVSKIPFVGQVLDR